MEKYKELYDSFLESGELKRMVPGMKGDWEKDKTRFIKEQQKLEDLLGN